MKRLFITTIGMCFTVILFLAPAAYACNCQHSDLLKPDASCNGFGPGECFESNGWVVQIVKQGGFPIVSYDSEVTTTFRYEIIPKNPPPWRDIDRIDLLIPILDPELISVTSVPAGAVLDYDIWAGQFGAGLPNNDVFKWKPNKNYCGGTISVTFKGERTAAPKPMVLPFFALPAFSPAWPNGIILAPSGVETRPAVQSSTFTLQDTEGATCQVTLTPPPNLSVSTSEECHPSLPFNKSDLQFGRPGEGGGVDDVIEFPDFVWVGTQGSPRAYTYCYPNGQCITIYF